MPVLLFLLLFHAGGGAAVVGWFMFARFEYATLGLATLLFGLLGLLAGVAGFAIETVMRVRAQAVRQELEAKGGWKSEGKP